ncbi:hypothetical protein HHK36_022285 [Tetracentron sinense]|uniref:Uncharacterized protein n=1 Tax=Tetracentron sinense TaxID=13715 RepID=A0A834YQK0_TETSI|nr:hypothetical protein HHK36_022285 [Tetracentron sinense]
MRMVNFIIFVVNGLSVLKSMVGEDDLQYNHMLTKMFSCPYLSSKGFGAFQMFLSFVSHIC